MFWHVAKSHFIMLHSSLMEFLDWNKLVLKRTSCWSTVLRGSWALLCFSPLPLSPIGGVGYTRICILVNVQKGLAPFQAQQTYSDVLIALNEDICPQLNNWNRQKRKTNLLCGSELQIAIWHVTVARQPHVSAHERVCAHALTHNGCSLLPPMGTTASHDIT